MKKKIILQILLFGISCLCLPGCSAGVGNYHEKEIGTFIVNVPDDFAVLTDGLNDNGIPVYYAADSKDNPESIWLIYSRDCPEYDGPPFYRKSASSVCDMAEDDIKATGFDFDYDQRTYGKKVDNFSIDGMKLEDNPNKFGEGLDDAYMEGLSAVWNESLYNVTICANIAPSHNSYDERISGNDSLIMTLWVKSDSTQAKSFQKQFEYAVKTVKVNEDSEYYRH